jgi:hypothetical protein
MQNVGVSLNWLSLASAVFALTAAFTVVLVYRIRAAKRLKSALNAYALREMADSAPLKGPKRTKVFSTR